MLILFISKSIYYGLQDYFNFINRVKIELTSVNSFQRLDK